MEGFPEETELEWSHKVKIHPSAREMWDSREIAFPQIALSLETVRAQEQRIAGKGGAALVGRILAARRPQRKHMPDSLFCFFKKLQKMVAG
jgi:hypothetical protein